MKLQFEATKVETSGVEEQTVEHFKIRDARVLGYILHNKMYSDAIKAVAQEISSNARDAHIEVKKHTLPIEITLPNDMNPTFSVRDFGPGISPQRVADVFVNYGDSTKRGSNKEIGGFGLGAKCPFAYGDAFVVQTVTPNEQGKLIKRVYNAIKNTDINNKNSLGTFPMLSEEETTDPQGTEVIVPVKAGDFDRFAHWVRNTCLFWDVKPVVKGYKGFTWPEVKDVLSTNNWKIVENNYSVSGSLIITVDGIPYPIDSNQLKEDGHVVLNYMKRNNQTLILKAKIGQVFVAATRETLDYITPTVDFINNRMTEIKDELPKKAVADVLAQKTLLEAYNRYYNYKNKFDSLMPKVDWVSKDNDLYSLNTALITVKSHINTAKNRATRSNNVRIDDYAHVVDIRLPLVFADTEEKLSRDDAGRRPSVRRVRGMFNDWATKGNHLVGITTVQLVTKIVKDDVEFEKLRKILPTYNLMDYNLAPPLNGGIDGFVVNRVSNVAWIGQEQLGVDSWATLIGKCNAKTVYYAIRVDRDTIKADISASEKPVETYISYAKRILPKDTVVITIKEKSIGELLKAIPTAKPLYSVVLEGIKNTKTFVKVTADPDDNEFMHNFITDGYEQASPSWRFAELFAGAGELGNDSLIRQFAQRCCAVMELNKNKDKQTVSVDSWKYLLEPNDHKYIPKNTQKTIIKSFCIKGMYNALCKFYPGVFNKTGTFEFHRSIRDKKSKRTTVYMENKLRWKYMLIQAEKLRKMA